MTRKKVVSLPAIEQAYERIQGLVLRTPTPKSLFHSLRHEKNIYLKLENFNISGSFKIRGAANALLLKPREELSSGVVAASAGNHAQGVANVCRHLKVKATIFMPVGTPLIKVESTKQLGAEVVLVGDTYDDAYDQALAFQNNHKAVMIHPFADEDVICGQGSIAIELIEQFPDLGMVIVPIGGGGLISGIACALKEVSPKTKIIGVQAAAFPAMQASLAAGKPLQSLPASTIADGIAVKSVHPLNYSLIERYVDDIVLVEEEEIAAAIMELMERNRTLAEGAGAASVAAFNAIASKNWYGVKNQPIVSIICGGNIDINLLRKITMRGMIYSGRMMRLRAKIKDRPGSLADLLEVLGDVGANILEIHHDRSFSQAHYQEVEVDIEIETASLEHQHQIKSGLDDANINYELLEAVVQRVWSAT